MAGCKRCALKRGKRKREIEEKRKGKRKNGDQNRFFFISPCACFFICAVVIFQIYKENCI